MASIYWHLKWSLYYWADAYAGQLPEENEYFKKAVEEVKELSSS